MMPRFTACPLIMAAGPKYPQLTPTPRPIGDSAITWLFGSEVMQVDISSAE
jgi:hypothetical protein